MSYLVTVATDSTKKLRCGTTVCIFSRAEVVNVLLWILYWLGTVGTCLCLNEGCK
jgi:hypothetical protein